MSEPFIGEIKMVGFSFPPRGWSFCDGQLLPISSNTALFSLLGTTFGGDGRSTMGLPDMRSRSPIHPGRGPGLNLYRWGQQGGAEEVTLTTQQIPSHSHRIQQNVSMSTAIDIPATGSTATEASPEGNILASSTTGGRETLTYAQPTAASGSMTATGQATATIEGNTLATGQSDSHYNVHPYLSVYFIIALTGIFPSRS